jgi:hypothetical protein
MSHIKNKGFLKKYQQSKSQRSLDSMELSNQVMEIARAGKGISEAMDICIICDTRDVCNPCDWNDFHCERLDGVCITQDSCDFDDYIHVR